MGHGAPQQTHLEVNMARTTIAALQAQIAELEAAQRGLVETIDDLRQQVAERDARILHGRCAARAARGQTEGGLHQAPHGAQARGHPVLPWWPALGKDARGQRGHRAAGRERDSVVGTEQRGNPLLSF